MLGIVAFIGIFVATYFAYKTAKDYERNAVLWALAVFAVGFGLQVVIPFMLGLIIGLVLIAGGTQQEGLEQAMSSGLLTLLNIVCLLLSIVGMLLILRHLSTVPDDVSESSPPPPPSNFDLT